MNGNIFLSNINIYISPRDEDIFFFTSYDYFCLIHKNTIASIPPIFFLYKIAQHYCYAGYVEALMQIIETMNFSADVETFMEVSGDSKGRVIDKSVNGAPPLELVLTALIVKLRQFKKSLLE